MPQTRRYRIYDSGPVTVAPLLVWLALAAACGRPPANTTSKGTYDPQTGQLIQITYDRNSNGRIDTWTRMQGARPISSELDTNEDGVIDRWEEYDAEERLTRAGWTRQPSPDPAKPVADTWLYPSADGKTSRIEYLDADNTGKQVVARREFYEGERLARVEEDKDGDDVTDQWETWEGGTLKYAEFDEGNDGKPDRRFTYDKGVLVLIESAPDPSGAYTRRVVPGSR
jgi:hypothetical protein